MSSCKATNANAWRPPRQPVAGQPAAARALAEIIGWAKVLGSLDAKTIDRDSDPEIGELIEVQLPDAAGRDRFLRVRCGTGREFALPVPPTMRTALEANAWTYGIDAKEYRPEVRT